MVRFELPGKQGMSYPITWRGTVDKFERESQDSPVRLLADLIRYDEGGHEGVLNSFVRWLYLRTSDEG